ncbi:Asparagine synthase (Glutamine-hydrolyzing) [Desulfamplus magnetovallimortis]|uniref:asparagine synthase (glutamine-hydrolyzing) n=1 Tax=Desulfamplus magnetovallimortis TaxID=1246637 RepID=A0A1W1HLA9_9BACT|nr:asparagine synthase (glutamine-hydrolyzing) [Desulfamplus magnetovallimortis]SLM33138.1 Asparagine synthase (Glutamine-hydrolyzing) [Desulfamplus magnetovallimortis]
MCGICGIFHKQKIISGDIKNVKKMNMVLKHRGPDDEGIYEDHSCVLAHRRLSIIDLSSAGHQPFYSDDGRYVMVYNGEVYNYIELRKELIKTGWQFNTQTDTEVLLKAYQHYGEKCLHLFNGMFAFAIYDTHLNTLFLARDRVGIKPLYYSIKNSKLYFASEIKALWSIPELSLSVNEQAVFDYIVFNRTDVFDETFYNEIKRIPCGYFAHFSEGKLNLNQWWNPEDYLKDSSEDKLELDYISEKVHDIFVSAVNFRMRSDVPVGTCLSGGLDSSILLGVLYKYHNLSKDYPTFTASFPGHPIDESAYIENLRIKYPFSSYFTFPNSDMAYSQLEEFVYMNDEPTTNPSFFSQYQVMKTAAQNHVTVLLDGQGGDENFAGYQYFHGFNLYDLLCKRDIKLFLIELLKSIKRKQHISAYQTFVFQILPDVIRKKMLLRTLPYIKKDFFYNRINKSIIFNKFFDASDLNQSLVRHFQFKLEHLLRMEDRNSMAFSLEARVPYLDHRLIEFLLGVSPYLKIKDGETKYLQKKALSDYTTSEITNRKDKIGFGTPGEAWMKDIKWQKITDDNYKKLCKIFPTVFKKDYDKIPYSGFDRWKINQLAVWHDIFLMNQSQYNQ